MSPSSGLDWSAYTPLDAGVTGPLRDVTRADAEAHLARLLAARPARAAALAALAARHGVTLEPAPVGAWFAAALAIAGPEALTGAEAAAWTGAIADVALWLGERIIAATPTLSWRLCTSHKKATGYQRPVLMGFTKVDDDHYYVDLAFMVASWAELASRRRAVQPDFLATIERVTLLDA